MRIVHPSSNVTPFSRSMADTPEQISRASPPVVSIFTSTDEFQPDTLQGSLSSPVLSKTAHTAKALVTLDSLSASADDPQRASPRAATERNLIFDLTDKFPLRKGVTGILSDCKRDPRKP